jgi:hypothetical protein
MDASETERAKDGVERPKLMLDKVKLLSIEIAAIQRVGMNTLVPEAVNDPATDALFDTFAELLEEKIGHAVEESIAMMLLLAVTEQLRRGAGA